MFKTLLTCCGCARAQPDGDGTTTSVSGALIPLKTTPSHDTLANLSQLQSDASTTSFGTLERRPSLAQAIAAMRVQAPEMMSAVLAQQILPSMVALHELQPLPTNRPDIRSKMSQEDIHASKRHITEARKRDRQELESIGCDMDDMRPASVVVAADYRGTRGLPAYCGEHALLLLDEMLKAGTPDADMCMVQWTGVAPGHRLTSHQLLVCRNPSTAPRRPLDRNEFRRCLGAGEPLFAVDLWRQQGKLVGFSGPAAAADWKRHRAVVMKEVDAETLDQSTKETVIRIATTNEAPPH